MLLRKIAIGFTCMTVAVGSLMITNTRASAESTETLNEKNDSPIVLVHGLSGWGRDEMFGYKYWGGLRDIESDLKNDGKTVFSAAVGPLSSNWDRAVELYAQIKGGRVDYGEAHSKEHNHARFGRTYEGFYPEWGEIDPNTGKENKVHFIGHSMGGQTIRVLDQLIESGYKEERDMTPANELSPLFANEDRGLVHSITTITTPHDGSPYVYAVDNMVPFVQQMVALAASVTGRKDEPHYDFKMDQWGLKREAGESLVSYINRVKNSSLWKMSKDTGEWDLSPEGAKELNDWVKARPDVYYFSVSASNTYRGFLGYHLPRPTMNPALLNSSYYIGRYKQSGNNGLVNVTSSWWENDGIVPVASMDAPQSERVVSFNGTARAGMWNHLETLNRYDHLDVVGHGLSDMRSWYRNLSDQLSSLPN
ncbi:lipase [Hazenella sp. IB182357]|uniref:triacylglycerol lipase n=1 Tax=Polycladospora coralii TaxID=2771432 RepID=A0A926RU65_9BACL|nr:lipase [Polycladospora coralii]MBD1372553.1 lipase [Polycladospora coralii]MBS7531324.1 lipase [Polycladospora coralii]